MDTKLWTVKRQLPRDLDFEDLVLFVNSEVLGQEVIDNVSNFDQHSEELPSSEDYEKVTMPRFLYQLVHGVYRSDESSMLEDLVTYNLLYNAEFLSEFSAIMAQWQEIEDVDVSGIVSLTSKKEFGKRQLLVGAPIYHTALPEGRHQNHDEIPKDFHGFDWEFVERLAEEWNRRYFNGSGVDAYDYSHSSSPRLTSQGLLLKGRDEDSKLRFARKSLQAKFAVRAKTSDVNQLYSDLKQLNIRYGFEWDYKNFIVGIRRQQSSKPEPVQADSNAAPSSPVVGYTKHYQGRIRGIFMPPELTKIHKKGAVDVIKDKLMTEHDAFRVDPDHIGSFLTAITKKQFELSDNLPTDQRVSYDFDEFDTTQHKGLYDLYQRFIRQLIPNYDDRFEPEFMAEHGVITSTSPYKNSDLVKYNTRGRSKLSGEPEVTISNNIIAYLSFLRAWSCILGEDPVTLDKYLSNSEGYIAKIHGDDGSAYMSDKIEDYDEFQRLIHLMGLKLSFEEVPIFLKKVDSSLYKDKRGEYLKPGTIYGVPGSILKNRLGEYPKKRSVLIIAGVIDTLDLIPSDSKYGEIYGQLCEMLIDHLTGFSSVSEARAYKDSGEFQKDIEEYAKQSISSAAEVKYLIDRMYFSSGELLRSDSLEELYGSFSYDIDDINATTFPDSLEELRLLILEEQEMILNSDGNSTVLTDYLQH